MSETIIEKLLKGAEVEWKPLGEIVKIADNARRAIKAELRKAGATPYYGANNIQDYVQGYTHEGDYVLVAEDGSKSLLNYSVQWACGCFWANNHVHVIQGNDKVINRFLFHVLKNINFLPFLSGGTRAKLTKAKLINIPIPIPPLSVQKEIVRILDAFTVHTAELTAELNERKKQYNYYLNKLLTFSDDEVEWKSLGEMLKRTGGTSITAEKMKELNKANGALKIFAGGRTFAFADFNDIPEKDINKYPSIIVKSRGNIEFDYYDKPFSHKKEFWSYHSENDNIDIKYIYYYVKNKEQYFQHIGNKMQMPQISIRDTDIFLVPVPPISVQKEIVRKLDAFSTLTTSISEGLPREIELRNKQYEYYRDQLLNFPKPANYAIKHSPTNL